MLRRCPNSSPLGPAWLPGYRLVLRRYADIEPAPECRVRGVLYRMSAEDWTALDGYEGVDRNHYARVPCQVEVGVQTLRAETYSMVVKGPPERAPDEYVERLARGYLDWAFPEDELLAAHLVAGLDEETVRQILVERLGDTA